MLRVLGREVTGTGLAAASRGGYTFGVDLFLKAGVSANAKDAAGTPVLLLACENEQLPVVLRLLEAGADPNAAAADGRTPLMVAATKGNLCLLECLGQAGALPNNVDAQGHSALHYAIQTKAIATLTWLINFGVPLEGECCNGQRSLVVHALETNDLEVLDTLLQAQKHVHPIAWTRPTREAFLNALRIQNKSLVRVLLKNHQDPPAPEGFRQSFLAYSIAWGQTPLLKLLLECGADPDSVVGNPVERPFIQLIPDENTRFYLEKETNLTPLMLASAMGRLDCVEALLQYGAKRGKVTGHYKMAAISFAAHNHHPEVMQVLLGKSPRPEDQHLRIEISLSRQQAVLWKDNRPLMAAPVSTGKPGFPTPSGCFVITDKERMRFSSIYKVSMPYFMRLNCSEFGMHEGVVPDYPASHGCIRLPREAAIRFFHEVDPGILVMIRP